MNEQKAEGGVAEEVSAPLLRSPLVCLAWAPPTGQQQPPAAAQPLSWQGLTDVGGMEHLGRMWLAAGGSQSGRRPSDDVPRSRRLPPFHADPHPGTRSHCGQLGLKQYRLSSPASRP